MKFIFYRDGIFYQLHLFVDDYVKKRESLEFFCENIYQFRKAKGATNDRLTVLFLRNS